MTVVLISSLFYSSVALAKKKPAKKPGKVYEVEGKLRDVSSEYIILEKTKKKGKKDVKINLKIYAEAKTKIKREGKKASIDDLLIGDKAKILYRIKNSDKIAKAIKAGAKNKRLKGPDIPKDAQKIDGIIANVDENLNTINIAAGEGEDGGESEISLSIDSNTLIVKNNKDIKLFDLAIGDEVKVLYAERNGVNIAYIIKVKEEVDLEIEEGKIQEIDEEASTVTIKRRTDEVITLKVDENTKIKIEGRDENISIADLAVGNEVNAKYNIAEDGSYLATKIEVMGQED